MMMMMMMMMMTVWLLVDRMVTMILSLLLELRFIMCLTHLLITALNSSLHDDFITLFCLFIICFHYAKELPTWKNCCQIVMWLSL